MRSPRQHRTASVGRTFPNSRPVDEELTTAQVRELRERLGVESPEALREGLARDSAALSPKTRSAATMT